MDHFEMVEKLRQKASVTYEEAKAALEASDWDMLDALVLLEGQGKVRPEEAGVDYSTKPQPERPAQEKHWYFEWSSGVKRLGRFLCKVFQKGNTNSFVISRKGSELVSMPITVLVLLGILCWPFSLIALVAGLFLGLRYAFRGPDMGDQVNAIMDKAADAAQGKNEPKA